MLAAASLLIASVIAVGENCAQPSTAWELLACPIISNTVSQVGNGGSGQYQDACIPKRTLPNSATDIASAGQIKGVVVTFHGFTACPDAFDSVTQVLADNGYLVLSPLILGQGLAPGFGCNVNDTCVASADGSFDNPSLIPTKKEDYFTWTQTVINAANDEVSRIPASQQAPGFNVQAMGLSFGGALATYSAQIPNSPITRILNANPYYSSTIPTLDFSIYSCDISSDPKGCIVKGFQSTFLPSLGMSLPNLIKLWGDNIFTQALQSIINSPGDISRWTAKQTIGSYIVNDYQGFLSSLYSVMSTLGDQSSIEGSGVEDASYGWGANCIAQRKAGRGGICTFKIRHLVALQSTVEYIVGNIGLIPSSVVYADIHSDMDGIARDSVSQAVVDALAAQGSTTSRCHFAIKPTCVLGTSSWENNDNLCGVPHSCYSQPESTTEAPGNRFWEQSLEHEVLNFISGASDVVGADSGDYTQCTKTSTTLINTPQMNAIGTDYIKNSKAHYGGKAL